MTKSQIDTAGEQVTCGDRSIQKVAAITKRLLIKQKSNSSKHKTPYIRYMLTVS